MNSEDIIFNFFKQICDEKGIVSSSSGRRLLLSPAEVFGRLQSAWKNNDTYTTMSDQNSNKNIV